MLIIITTTTCGEEKNRGSSNDNKHHMIALYFLVHSDFNKKRNRNIDRIIPLKLGLDISQTHQTCDGE